jgi:hypothetical protein
MSSQKAVKKVYQRSMAGRRCRGKPKLKWIDDVEEDLRSVGVKRWRKRTLDRREWAAMMREAKAKF